MEKHLKHFILYGILLCTVGFILAYLMIPDDKERARQLFMDRNYDAARVIYEELIQDPAATPDLYFVLSRIYAQQGNVEAAIRTVETLIAKSPDSKELRKELGEYYQATQKEYAYLENLEIMNQMSPSDQLLLEMARLYGANAQYPKQTQALEQLLDSASFKPTLKELVPLLDYYAYNQKGEAAIHLIETYQETLCQAEDPRIIELMMHLCLDHQKKMLCLESLNNYIQMQSSLRQPAILAHFGQQLIYRNQFQLAEQLLNKYPHLKHHADLLPILLESLFELQRYGEIKELILQQKKGSVPLTVLLYQTFLEAPSQRQLGFFINRVNPNQLPTELLLKLAFYLREHPDPKTSTLLIEKIKPSKPHLAKVIHAICHTPENVALDDIMRTQLEDGLLTNTPEPALISLLISHDLLASCEVVARPFTAIELLKTLDPVEFTELAYFIQSKRQLMAELRESETIVAQNEKEKVKRIHLLWAVMTGDVGPIEKHLATNQLQANDYAELYFLADRSNQLNVAVSIAQDWVTNHPSVSSKQLLYDSLLKNKQLIAAQELLVTLDDYPSLELAIQYLDLNNKLPLDNRKSLPHQLTTFIKSLPVPTPTDRAVLLTSQLLEQDEAALATEVLLQVYHDLEPEWAHKQLFAYLYNQNKSPQVLQWMIQRSAFASGIDQAEWLLLLNQLQQAVVTLEINLDQSDPLLALITAHALSLTNQLEASRQILFNLPPLKAAPIHFQTTQLRLLYQVNDSTKITTLLESISYQTLLTELTPMEIAILLSRISNDLKQSIVKQPISTNNNNAHQQVLNYLSFLEDSHSTHSMANLPEDFLINSFYHFSQQNSPRVIQISEYLFHKSPTPTYQSMYLDALSRHASPAQTLEIILEENIQKDPEAVGYLLNALSQVSPQIESAQESGLLETISQTVQTTDPKTYPDYYRNMGYLLSDHNHFKEAGQFFLNLCVALETPTEADIKQLAFCHRQMPQPEIKVWLETKTNEAQNDDKLFWLNMLFNAGETKSIIAHIEETGGIL